MTRKEKMMARIEKSTDEKRILLPELDFNDINAKETGNKMEIMTFKSFCRPWMGVSTILNILKICKMF